MDLLSQAEISKFCIAVFKDQNVFWFQIPVHNVVGVKVFYAKDEAAEDEPHCIFACLLEIVESGGGFVDKGVGVSSRCPLHDEVEVVLISECIVQGCDEFAFGFLQNLFLQFQIRGKFLSENFGLYDSLDGVLFNDSLGFVLLELSQEDLSESSATYFAQNLKAFPFDGFGGWIHLLDSQTDVLFFRGLDRNW